MPDLRPIILVLGVLIGALGVAMLVPMAADLSMDDPVLRAEWRAFAVTSALCLIIGGGMFLTTTGSVQKITLQQSFLISALSWLVLVIFAAIPFYLGRYTLSPTDAFFESMSALTTTGATVIVGLDEAPFGLLLWRSILQWIGGIGIIIMAMAVMPLLSIGGMQLFKIESSDSSDKVFSHTSTLAAAITGLYLFFTALCYLFYWGFGLSSFDALNHAMTTIATGGFSTKDASFGYFLSDPNVKGPVDLVAAVFMLVGSLPFGLYLLTSRGQWGAIGRDAQARFFLTMVLAFVSLITWRVMSFYDGDVFESFRRAAFNVISIMTGTGYATTDYGLWGSFAFGFFFCIMFIGGCAGSTSCGMKVFRLQIVISALRLFGKRLAFPHGVFVASYNGRPLTPDIFISVLTFFFVYFATFATASVALTLFDLDPITALSAAGAAIANVGPGLGDVVGPSGNYKSLPDGAKWVLSIAMLFGRLEFFTLLILLSPSFWNR